MWGLASERHKLWTRLDRKKEVPWLDFCPCRKNAVEVELTKCKIDMMSLNSQLLDAIQQKVNLSQQLEAWQVSRAGAVGHTSPGPPAGTSPLPVGVSCSPPQHPCIGWGGELPSLLRPFWLWAVNSTALKTPLKWRSRRCLLAEWEMCTCLCPGAGRGLCRRCP